MECDKHKDFEDKIDKLITKVEKVLTTLADGKVNFATIHLRLRILETIVYGGVGISLIYLLKTILAAKGA